jgi:hypothetical protein
VAGQPGGHVARGAGADACGQQARGLGLALWRCAPAPAPRKGHCGTHLTLLRVCVSTSDGRDGRPAPGGQRVPAAQARARQGRRRRDRLHGCAHWLTLHAPRPVWCTDRRLRPGGVGGGRCAARAVTAAVLPVLARHGAGQDQPRLLPQLSVAGEHAHTYTNPGRSGRVWQGQAGPRAPPPHVPYRADVSVASVAHYMTGPPRSNDAMSTRPPVHSAPTTITVRPLVRDVHMLGLGWRTTRRAP